MREKLVVRRPYLRQTSRCWIAAAFWSVASLAAVCAAGSAFAADPLTVHVDKPGIKINPIIFGLMTEEINHSYDGGLYAEMISNRNFKEGPALFEEGPTANHWSVVTSGNAAATIALDYNEPVNSTGLSTSLRLDIQSAGNENRAGIANEGYWGIAVRPDTEYRVSFHARSDDKFSGPLAVDIESNDAAKILASATVPSITTKWQKYELKLRTGAELKPSVDNRFIITAANPGAVWFSLVSCFPPTFKDRPNGIRPDIMQLLLDMKPGFLRFPGGNGLEGRTVENRFAWKRTLHGNEERPGRWAPSRYRSNDGMGLLEFLLWCEDMRAEPILAVYSGYSVGAMGSTTGVHINPGPDLEPFVQEALEEVEYVTGDAATTTWGAQRAKDGHPEPFKLRYVEIGNEDGFDRSGSYEQRFARFQAAFKKKYPELKLIGSTRLRTQTPDVQDDHYYQNARAMAENSRRYDNAGRSGLKFFIGEWASREGKNLTPNLRQALGDAAFMTGLERNSDVLIGACYAPLLANVNPITPTWLSGGATWTTDMIGFDALRSFGSPSYYAQKMFYTNRADTSLPVDMPQGIYAAAGRMDATGDVILKIVNFSGDPRPLQISLQGMTEVAKEATGELLTGLPTDMNSVDDPMKVAPKPITISDAASSFVYEVPAYSAGVIRLKKK
ncbi:MAG: alpha-L-arabinofuranosidase C-terminal domain-containing protein [Thermoguttaceae bacterium]|jgi:alpha-N-arabinofuranosidase